MNRAIVHVDNFTGKAVPEAWIQPTVNELVAELHKGNDVGPIGQAELATGIRVAVKQGRLGGREIAFKFQDWIVPVLPDGQMSMWPPGFPGDVNDQLLSAVIGWGDKQ